MRNDKVQKTVYAHGYKQNDSMQNDLHKMPAFAIGLQMYQVYRDSICKCTLNGSILSLLTEASNAVLVA